MERDGGYGGGVGVGGTEGVRGEVREWGDGGSTGGTKEATGVAWIESLFLVITKVGEAVSMVVGDGR